MDRTLPFTGNAPTRGHDNDAGLDLVSNEDLIIGPHGSATISLGTSVKIPEGHFGFLTHRSSLAFVHNTVISMGVVDCGYTGEIKAKAFNLGNDEVHIERGQRVCQLVIIPVSICTPVKKKSLETTKRGSKGFGSTGRLSCGKCASINVTSMKSDNHTTYTCNICGAAAVAYDGIGIGEWT
jgi:dUTP pyrophosphatase